MKWLIRLLIGAIFIYCLILLAIFIFQRDLLYFPRDHYNPPPDWMAEVKAEDGSLFWWAAPERDTAPVLMVFHGNGSVSYTHLRAHETKANLVCRLLLEKKN